MKLAAAFIALLPAMATAQPVKDCPSTTRTDISSTPTPTPQLQPFGMMAFRSASPIHFGTINASGRNLWIGRETSTYCPSNGPCSAVTSNNTAFFPGGGAMYAMVPGGQQVYVDPNGTFGFTQAHSTSIPPGSFQGGGNQTAPTDGRAWGYFSTSAGGATGLFACPTSGSGNTGKGPWKIFANVKGADVSKCLGFTAAAIPYTGPYAWQYV